MKLARIPFTYSPRRWLSLATRPASRVPYETGQPTHETRPHYLPIAGQLTPGISALEYYERRLALADQLPENLVAILVGQTTRFASGSVFYDFQQDNDVFYLSGWLEPNSVLAIEKRKGSGNPEDVVFHMLVPKRNPQVELWEGHRSGLEGAMDYFNADEVEDVERSRAYITLLIQNRDHVFFDEARFRRQTAFLLFFQRAENISILDTIKAARKPVQPLAPLVARQRAIKLPAEILVMQKAGQISARAINRVIATVGLDQPFKTEKTLAKGLEYEFVRGGCDKQAYIPVVASGKNALTIHYTRNDDLLYEDEMVFVDAGGKLGGYCADISRTWPNSAKGFSDPQKDIYNAVLATNKACIDQCFEENGVSLHEIHELSVSTLARELKNLPGFLAATQNELSRSLYPHYVGHHLGLDLHDVPHTSRLQHLVAGNVITIEPGLYVPFDDSKWPKHYQGIGVRVEDDVVVGKGPGDVVNLTSLCVKEVEDIESLIRLGHVTTPGAYEEAVEVMVE